MLYLILSKTMISTNVLYTLDRVWRLLIILKPTLGLELSRNI